MYRCGRCGSDIDDGFDRCWNCNEAVPASPSGEMMAIPQVRATFRSYRGALATWDSLFTEVAAFATTLGPDRVITIAHASDGGEGVVTVWFWDDGGVPSGDAPRDGGFSILDPG